MKRKYNYIFLFFLLIAGCNKDNPVKTENEVLIYQRDGIIESFGGDCSAVQVRTSSLGNFGLNSSDRLKFNFSAFSDADLSSISVYYIQNDETVNLLNLPHRDQINSTQTVTIDSPDYSGELFLRLTLKSSVCTGQIFHIEMRDLKIYTLN